MLKLNDGSRALYEKFGSPMLWSACGLHCIPRNDRRLRDVVIDVVDTQMKESWTTFQRALRNA